MKKKVAITLIVSITLLGILTYIEAIFNKEEGKITFLDYPNKLSTKVEIIEVIYIDWACACANWLPTNYTENPNYEITENASDCIFLEADNDTIKITEIYKKGKQNLFRLSGKYYQDRGISRDYKKTTSEKPKRAKVFRYTKAELIKNKDQ